MDWFGIRRPFVPDVPDAPDSDEPAAAQRVGHPYSSAAPHVAEFDGDCAHLGRLGAAGRFCLPASPASPAPPAVAAAEAPPKPREYKVVLAGASGAGKTAFARRHRTGVFEDAPHAPTRCVEVHPLRFHTTAGPIRLEAWDLAGDPRYAGRGPGYYAGAQGLLAFYDLTRLETLSEARAVLEAHAGLPAVLVGGRVDLADENVVRTHPAPGTRLPYWEVSARTGYNFEKPILSLVRLLVGDDALQFAEAPPVPPAAGGRG